MKLLIDTGIFISYCETLFLSVFLSPPCKQELDESSCRNPEPSTVRPSGQGVAERLSILLSVIPKQVRRNR